MAFAACTFCTQFLFVSHMLCHDSTAPRLLTLKVSVCLPVNDDGVRRGLIPVATTLLITASTTGEMRGDTKKGMLAV